MKQILMGYQSKYLEYIIYFTFNELQAWIRISWLVYCNLLLKSNTNILILQNQTTVNSTS